MVYVIGALIVLALVAVSVIGMSLRKGDSNAAYGQLASETIKRDRSPVTLTDSVTVAEPGKALEASVRAEQRGGTLVKSGGTSPVAYVPPDPETVGVARRQFLNRGVVAMFGLGLSGFGTAAIAFLWPQGGKGFGSKITVGRIPDIQAAITAGGGFFYVPEGRMWITEYPASALQKASSYSFLSQVEQGLKAGVVALYQTCPHLGCRVPECKTSQWFECPCHGSQYNRVGEKKGGPAPRGMDRFPMEVTAANELQVNTGVVIQGPPIGTNTTGQEAEGPNCISGGAH
ncbi:MAG: Rieske 2Fe-2S domain-containing protein [Actinomycetota bacterium]|nr:Rieske 2Fe-2S domain-containing protein [Actinomycetota bacterium]